MRHLTTLLSQSSVLDEMIMFVSSTNFGRSRKLLLLLRYRKLAVTEEQKTKKIQSKMLRSKMKTDSENALWLNHHEMIKTIIEIQSMIFTAHCTK